MFYTAKTTLQQQQVKEDRSYKLNAQRYNNAGASALNHLENNKKCKVNAQC
jgi:hypothetical protein